MQFSYGDGLQGEAPSGKPADGYQQIRYYLYAVSGGLFDAAEAGPCGAAWDGRRPRRP
ncbi:MAG: hypothetical protein U0797_14480 [Gemmataceae bacterium]